MVVVAEQGAIILLSSVGLWLGSPIETYFWLSALVFGLCALHGHILLQMTLLGKARTVETVVD